LKLPVNLNLMKTNIVFNLCLALCLIVSIVCFNTRTMGQNPCGNFAGNPQPMQYLCSGSPAVGPAIEAIIAPNSILKYYLHDGNISNFIDENQTGLFFNNTGSYPTNMQLYISSAVGSLVNDVVDFDDPCTDIQLPGSPVVFLDPITINHEFECNNTSVDVNYMVNGGYPAYISSTFTIQGSTNNITNVAVNNSFNLLPLNDTYILFAEDEKGCKASITQNYECEEIQIEGLDLAIQKRLASGQSNVVTPGSIVTFTIEVINQGSIPVSQISLVDYIPTGLTLNDNNWIQIGQNAEVLLTTTPPPFLPGTFFTFDISFTVDANVSTTSITNTAEISFIRLQNGDVVYTDDDSTFDIINNNDGTPVNDAVDDPNDEDDHDIETITIDIETCAGVAGNMPTDTIFACDEETASAVQTGSTPAPGDEELYILHTNSTNTPGTIIDSNNTGNFANPNDDCTTLYISYVFGPDDGSGSPDLDNNCTVILPGTPVVWTPPITINSFENCDTETEMYTISYDVNGGFAACGNSKLSVTGDVNPVVATPGQTYDNMTNFGNNSTYTITVTDIKGCTNSVVKGPVICEDANPCDSSPGTMPADILFGCADAQISSSETGSQLGGNDVDLYVLHDNATSTINNIISSNTTGNFNDPQLSCDMLYISYVLGPDDGTGKPNLTSPCTYVLSGTPVIWASPVSITTEIDCDETAEMFTYDYTVTGGFPACNSSSFTMSGDVNLTTASEGTTYTNSTELNNGDSYSITATDEQGCIATFSSNAIVCESTNTCENEAGTMPSTQLEACANASLSSTQNGSSLASADVDIYYLHDNPTGLGNIISSDDSGTFSDPSMYCTTLYISYVFGPDDGNGVPDINNPCTKILNGTPVLWLPEVTLSSTAQCETGANQYLISYTIAGGASDCNPSAEFSLTGTVTGNNIMAGNNTHPNIIDGGTSYQITVTDEYNCSASYNSELIDCLIDLPFCGNTPGEMQAADNPMACAESTITATQTGAYLFSDYIGAYYLHTNANTTLGTVIDSNNTGTFSNPNMPCTTLYISFVFGPDDGNGNILLDDDCTFVLQGTPVIWGEPLSLATIENCNQSTGMYTIDLSIGGGFAACDNTIKYNVSGDITLNGVDADIYTSNSFSGDTSYSITLADGNNCVTTYDSGLITCNVVCGNFEGTPNEAQILCENEISNGGLNDVVVSPGSTLVYVLHNGLNMLDTIYAVNSDGSFLNDGTYPVNHQLYISTIIGQIANNDSIPDMSDDCTAIGLPGTPVVFLTDISITTDIMCEAGEATITYVPNGGHPAFDNSLSYTITGSDNATVLFRDTTTFTDTSGSFTLTATDGLGCSSTISELTECEDGSGMCLSQIGSQPIDAFILCDGDQVDASSEGFLVQQDATLVYVLHDGNTNLGAIEDINSTGIFTNSGIYPTDTQFYIAAMIGVLSPAGVPDLNDDCTRSNFPGTPVTFLKPLSIEQNYLCEVNGTATVTFTINGGTGNYSITGSYTGSATAGEMVSFSNPIGNTMYVLEVTDSNGCKKTEEQMYDECIPSCTNKTGIVSQEAVFLCADNSFEFSVDSALVQEDYTLVYALHDGENMLGTVANFSTNGSIINDGSYDPNTQYFVSPLISTLLGGEPNLNDPCLFVGLPGRPVRFFSPFTIDYTVECSGKPSAEYNVIFSITGGAPATTEAEDKYFITGFFGREAIMNEVVTSPPRVESELPGYG